MQDNNDQTQIETKYFIGFGTVSEYFGNIKNMGKPKKKTQRWNIDWSHKIEVIPTESLYGLKSTSILSDLNFFRKL